MFRPCKKCGVMFDAHRCKECDKANAKRYREENREKVNQKNKAWRSTNPDKAKELVASWRDRNKERNSAWRKAYDAANRKKRNLTEHARRARASSSGGKLSVNIKSRLFDLQRGLCACCRLPLGTDYHLDHIMPLALGGENVDSNAQLLRRGCNLKKNSKHPIDYMRSKGFLL